MLRHIREGLNDFDSESDEDSNEEDDISVNGFGIQKNKWILSPESTVRQAIDLLSFIIIIFISLYIPFVFSFAITTSRHFTYFEASLDIWFILEIILNFFTGYYEKGILIMERKKIFKNYMKGWFFADLISSIPTSFFDIISEDESYDVFKSAKLLRILRMAKYARLLRIIRFIKVNKFV
jgi:hypothetical protein